MIHVYDRALPVIRNSLDHLSLGCLSYAAIQKGGRASPAPFLIPVYLQCRSYMPSGDTVWDRYPVAVRFLQ